MPDTLGPLPLRGSSSSDWPWAGHYIYDSLNPLRRIFIDIDHLGFSARDGDDHAGQQ
jgi:hypothetical protein